MGRWTENESFGAKYIDGFNLYEYVGADPVTRVDPLGLSWYWYPGLGEGLLSLFGEATPEVQAAFDESNWDRTNGTLDTFSGSNVDLSGLHGPNNGAYTFEPANRKSASCFAKCWEKKMLDAVIMGYLSDRGNPLSALPISPGSALFGDGLFNANGFDWAGTVLSGGGYGLNAWGQSMDGDRAALRRMWKDQTNTGRDGTNFQEWSEQNSENMESLENAADLAEKAGKAAAAASLAYELYKCYRDCGCHKN